MFILLGLVGLFVLLYLLSLFEDRRRNHNESQLLDRCYNVDPFFQVVVFGTQSQALAESIFSIIQNATCPKALKVIVIEQVKAFEEYSSTLQTYANAVRQRGNYITDFLDHIELHQVLEGPSFMDDVKAFLRNERPFTLLTSDRIQFVKFWDLGLYSASQNIHKNYVYFLGGVQGSSTIDSAFTYVTSIESLTNEPTIAWRPMYRQGPSLDILWFSFPVLMSSGSTKYLEGPTPRDAEIAWSLHMPMKIHTFPTPVGIQTDMQMVPKIVHTIDWPEGSLRMDRLLGLNMDTAQAHEIIMKFGSISTLQRLLNQ